MAAITNRVPSGIHSGSDTEPYDGDQPIGKKQRKIIISEKSGWATFTQFAAYSSNEDLLQAIKVNLAWRKALIPELLRPKIPELIEMPHLLFKSKVPSLKLLQAGGIASVSKEIDVLRAKREKRQENCIPVFTDMKPGKMPKFVLMKKEQVDDCVPKNGFYYAKEAAEIKLKHWYPKEMEEFQALIDEIQKADIPWEDEYGCYARVDFAIQCLLLAGIPRDKIKKVCLVLPHNQVLNKWNWRYHMAIDMSDLTLDLCYSNLFFTSLEEWVEKVGEGKLPMPKDFGFKKDFPRPKEFARYTLDPDYQLGDHLAVCQMSVGNRKAALLRMSEGRIKVEKTWWSAP